MTDGLPSCTVTELRAVRHYLRVLVERDVRASDDHDGRPDAWCTDCHGPYSGTPELTMAKCALTLIDAAMARHGLGPDEPKCAKCGKACRESDLLFIAAELRCRPCHESGAYMPGRGYGDREE